MEIPVYLAMTAAEFRTYNPLPLHPAWLSCLFSPYGQGLSNVPKQLPPNSLLILSDRTSPRGHDTELIFQTLARVIPELHCSGLLLDFERAENEENLEIAKALTSLPCPVAVSATYAHKLDCPVFLPAPPPSEPLNHHIAPWEGREIWLEISALGQTVTITETGAVSNACSTPPLLPFRDNTLSCHYAVDIKENEVTFTLHRTMDDLKALLSTHTSSGVTRAVGLFQEFQSDHNLT